MKAINAVIQTGKLHAIREALGELPGFPGMTVTRAEGCGPATEAGDLDLRQALTEFSPKVRIEILAPEEKVDEILGIIRRLAHTGRVGDGVAWVSPVDGFYRLRF